MIQLSVTIITFNEEKNIERCILSVKEVADEIVIVDSFSTDRTKEIALSHGAKFIPNKFDGHIQQKNFAIEQTKYSYVLSLDADEELSPLLKEEIKIVKENWKYDAYSFNRLTRYLDRWIKHCGWYPDQKIRLFTKEKARWGGENPHDLIIMAPNTEVRHIKGDLLHYSYNSVQEHIEQTKKFTSIAAKVYFSQGKKSNLFKIYTRPLFTFIKNYFLQLGFLDGKRGFTVCSINAWYSYLKYFKIYQLQKES